VTATEVWERRAEVRATLYIATLVGSRYNPVIAEFYKRLIARDGKHKVAIAVCMRRILSMLNATIRDSTESRDVPESA
jgi:transposase